MNNYWHRDACGVKVIVVHISKTLGSLLTTMTKNIKTECSHTGNIDVVRNSSTGNKRLDRAFCIRYPRPHPSYTYCNHSLLLSSASPSRSITMTSQRPICQLPQLPVGRSPSSQPFASSNGLTPVYLSRPWPSICPLLPCRDIGMDEASLVCWRSTLHHQHCQHGGWMAHAHQHSPLPPTRWTARLHEWCSVTPCLVS